MHIFFSFGRVVKRNSGDKVSSTAAEAKTEVIINGRIHTVYEVAGGKIRLVKGYGSQLL